MGYVKSLFLESVAVPRAALLLVFESLARQDLGGRNIRALKNCVVDDFEDPECQSLQ